jgi:hypothetical protein
VAEGLSKTGSESDTAMEKKCAGSADEVPKRKNWREAGGDGVNLQVQRQNDVRSFVPLTSISPSSAGKLLRICISF